MIAAARACSGIGRIAAAFVMLGLACAGSGRLGTAAIAGPRAHALAAFVPTMHEGDTMPDVALVDQRGRPMTFSTYRGRVVVLAFAYTRCPDPRMCSLVTAKFARLQRLLRGRRVHLLEVTLDPAYDAPRVLARYGAAFRADASRWTLATGTAADVAEIAARAGLASTSVSLEDAHSEAVVILDPAGRVAARIAGNEWSAEQVVAEANAALGAPADPGVRFRSWLAAGVAAACGGGRSGISTATAIGLFVALLAVAGVVIARLTRRRRYGT